MDAIPGFAPETPEFYQRDADRAFRQLLENSPEIAVTVLTALAERLAPDSI